MLKRKNKILAGLVVLIMVIVSSCSAQQSAKRLDAPVPPLAPTSSSGGSSQAASQPLDYYSPLANAQYVSKDASIILRFGPLLDNGELDSLEISVEGTQSGAHSGKTILADDNRTVIYKPDSAFVPGEQVHVQVSSLSVNGGATFQPLDDDFTVASNQQAGAVASIGVPKSTPPSAYPMDLTLPQDIPQYTVSTTSPDLAGEGDFFLAPFWWGESTVGSYLLILDNNGQIVYNKSIGNQLSGFDFKVLPGGYLTYYDQKDAVHVIMDSHYQVVGTYPAGDGYTADLHDFLLLPGGNMILMAYDTETIDMSKVVAGGNPSAAVTGLIIQELDPDQNVIFEWRSWDHIAFADTMVSLTDSKIDLMHGNGLALDTDGNLLISSRNMDEITKINLDSGEIMWRLGGKNSTFQFTNDSGFAYQHNIAVLPNGDITLFDNHGTDPAPAASRAVEYKLNLSNNTATKVWEYMHTPPVFTDYMGSIQRLADGNTVIGWGDPVSAQGYVSSSVTEITPDGRVVFEMTLDAPYVSYRAFKMPWAGSPKSDPTLAFTQDGTGITLGYSWNGVTGVAAWKLYDGSSPKDLSLVDQRAKSGFEMQSYLPYLPSNVCYFQVAAMDKDGNELARSAVISTNPTACPPG